MRKWINIHASRLLMGFALLALPTLYMISESIDFSRPNPHRHEIQNLLTYLSLVAFSYANHTIFVPKGFVWVHRSYIVALLHIQAVRNKLISIGDEDIPISNGFEADFNDAFGGS